MSVDQYPFSIEPFFCQEKNDLVFEKNTENLVSPLSFPLGYLGSYVAVNSAFFFIEPIKYTKYSDGVDTLEREIAASTFQETVPDNGILLERRGGKRLDLNTTDSIEMKPLLQELVSHAEKITVENHRSNGSVLPSREGKEKHILEGKLQRKIVQSEVNNSGEIATKITDQNFNEYFVNHTVIASKVQLKHNPIICFDTLREAASYFGEKEVLTVTNGLEVHFKIASMSKVSPDEVREDESLVALSPPPIENFMSLEELSLENSSIDLENTNLGMVAVNIKTVSDRLFDDVLVEHTVQESKVLKNNTIVETLPSVLHSTLAQESSPDTADALKKVPLEITSILEIPHNEFLGDENLVPVPPPPIENFLKHTSVKKSLVMDRVIQSPSLFPKTLVKNNTVETTFLAEIKAAKPLKVCKPLFDAVNMKKEQTPQFHQFENIKFANVLENKPKSLVKQIEEMRDEYVTKHAVTISNHMASGPFLIDITKLFKSKLVEYANHLIPAHVTTETRELNVTTLLNDFDLNAKVEQFGSFMKNKVKEKGGIEGKLYFAHLMDEKIKSAFYEKDEFDCLEVKNVTIGQVKEYFKTQFDDSSFFEPTLKEYTEKFLFDLKVVMQEFIGFPKNTNNTLFSIAEEAFNMFESSKKMLNDIHTARYSESFKQDGSAELPVVQYQEKVHPVETKEVSSFNIFSFLKSCMTGRRSAILNQEPEEKSELQASKDIMPQTGEAGSTEAITSGSQPQISVALGQLSYVEPNHPGVVDELDTKVQFFDYI